MSVCGGGGWGGGGGGGARCVMARFSHFASPPPPPPLPAPTHSLPTSYAVPASKFALARIDRLPSVVVSPRLVALAEERQRAILAHELGHAIDFHCFGQRYSLRARPEALARVDAGLRQQLLAIDAGEPDPEARADLLGELLVTQRQGARLCYDPVLLIQTAVPPSTPCDGGPSASGGGLLRHYPHAPLAGRVAARGGL